MVQKVLKTESMTDLKRHIKESRTAGETPKESRAGSRICILDQTILIKMDVLKSVATI